MRPHPASSPKKSALPEKAVPPERAARSGVHAPAVKPAADWSPRDQENDARSVAARGSSLLDAFRSAPEAFILADKDAVIHFWNQGAESLFGYSETEVMGRPLALLTSREEIPALAEACAGRRRTDVSVLTTEGRRKDGSTFPLHLSLGHRLPGRPGMRLVTARDNSREIQAAAALKASEDLHRKAEDELQYRLRFENLVTSISTHFINLPTERIDSGIQYALHALGEFAGVDRSYIFLFGPDSRTVDNTHEWCAIDIEPQIGRLKGLLVDRYPWFMERIQSLQAIHVPKVADLPAMASEERGEFEKEGIQSLIIVPMAYRGNLKGYLGFDSVRAEKHWPDEAIGLLRIAGEMFINAIERKKVDLALREAKSKYLNIFENSVEGICQTTPDGRFLSANPALARILGYEDAREMETLTDIAATLYVDPTRRGEFLRVLRERGRVTEFEFQARCKDGTVIWISENARAVKKPDGSLDFCEGMVMDVTGRKRMEEQLIHDTLHDQLTGLPNRTLCMERLGRAMERAKRRPGDLFAVLMLDLDRFKIINDSMGHLQGDRLLVAIARRLEAFLPPGTTLARLGGDEFCYVMEEMKDTGTATALADRIQEELAVPFDLDGREVYANSSIGIALGTRLYNGPEEVLRDADTAMYRAKLAGKARYEVFDASMHAKAVHLLTLETDLRKALERGEFRLHYQPIVSLVDGGLTGFEALIRWRHPTKGLVSPADFIPLSEDTGLIVPIGRWVLREACAQLAEWQLLFEGGKHLSMSVNLSGKQLEDEGFVATVEVILKETGVDPACLKLEVTESAIIGNADHAVVLLTQLRDLGLKLSLDDFGTGYSSLSYLHRFPFHVLKIDRSFVSKLESGTKDTEIVRVINSLARNLGMEVVAEGIETAGQWALLHRLECEYGQGFYFSRPLEVADARRLIERGSLGERPPG